MNAYYSGSDADPDELWAELPYLHRASSRASADFQAGMAAVWASTEGLSEPELREQRDLRRHVSLVPWEDLSEAERQKDRDVVQLTTALAG